MTRIYCVPANISNDLKKNISIYNQTVIHYFKRHCFDDPKWRNDLCLDYVLLFLVRSKKWPCPLLLYDCFQWPSGHHKVLGVMITQYVEELPPGKTTPDFTIKPIALTIQEGTGCSVSIL